jgi:hypothetical protein
MKVTLDKILLTQSPALFLAALLLIICYFVRRGNHHARAVLDLLLAIVSVGLGVALYYFGMLNNLFTIKNFWQIRTPGYVGMGVVALIALILFLKGIKNGIQRHVAEKKATRMETEHQKELEEVRQKAYASGMADAIAAETKTLPDTAAAAPDSSPLDPPKAPSPDEK